LIYAATFNRIEIAKLLIAAGASLEIEDATRKSALFSAVFVGNTEMTKLLIAAGA